MTNITDKDHDENYAKTWGTDIGQDSLSLNVSLAKWLGPRLVFLAENTTSLAPGAFENEEAHKQATKLFLEQMTMHGNVLIEYGENEENDIEAKTAMFWVAENFVHLWD
jgi:hypothetical protein